LATLAPQAKASTSITIRRLRPGGAWRSALDESFAAASVRLLIAGLRNR
jgi:hypothetical protein